MFQTKTDWVTEIPTLITLGQEGATYQTLGDKYGVSRERIRQVLKRYIPSWNENYGMDARRYKRIREEDVHRFQKWGKKEDTPLYCSQRRKFLAKKANAARAGWKWEIDFGDIEWLTHCPILGVELNYFTPVRVENSPSFDQIDPGKGYVKGNIQIMSWRANRIKNDGSAEEHRRVADWLDLRYKTMTLEVKD